MNQITAAVKGALKNPSSGSKPLSSNPPRHVEWPSSRPLRSWRSRRDRVRIGHRSDVGPTWRVVGDIFAHVGIGHNTLTPIQSTVSGRCEHPGMVIGLLAGSMLAVAGGTYQGSFEIRCRSVSTGVASGAGLGATFAIIDLSHGVGTPSWTPLLAFVGAMAAVTLTWLIGGRSMRSNTATLILAGVAVASCSRARRRSPATVECGIDHAGLHLATGSLASVGWGTVCWSSLRHCLHMICVGAGRALDVMSVGEDESRSLGVPVRRVRFIVIAASSLGTAAIVSAVG